MKPKQVFYDWGVLQHSSQQEKSVRDERAPSCEFVMVGAATRSAYLRGI